MALVQTLYSGQRGYTEKRGHEITRNRMGQVPEDPSYTQVVSEMFITASVHSPGRSR